MKKVNGEMYWEWYSTHFINSEEDNTFFRKMGTKIYILLKSILAFATISLITAFAFRIGLMASSVILLILSNNKTHKINYSQILQLLSKKIKPSCG